MIGIDFACFIILLIISVVVSVILHYGCKFYIMPGTTSFISKIIIGWLGAWLGSPVFGHWWEGLNYCHVYIVPAILGSFALLILSVDGAKTIGEACSKAPAIQGRSEDVKKSEDSES